MINEFPLTKPEQEVAARGFAMELSETLEAILDRRSQYGKAGADEGKQLKRCRFLAHLLEAHFQGIDFEPRSGAQ